MGIKAKLDFTLCPGFGSRRTRGRVLPQTLQLGVSPLPAEGSPMQWEERSDLGNFHKDSTGQASAA